MDKDLDRARKLCALAADERTPQGERAAAGIQLARLVQRAGLLDDGRGKSPLTEWITCTAIVTRLRKRGFSGMSPQFVGGLLHRLEIHQKMPSLCKQDGEYAESGRPRWVYDRQIVDVLAAHMQEVQ
jgi:hypothetical protein